MRRRRAVAAGGLASVALVAGGLAWAVGGDGSAGDGDDGSATGSEATATAAVTRRDLEERADLEGTLGYGDTSEVALGSSSGSDGSDGSDGSEGGPADDGDGGDGGDGGTITGLPAVGTVVDRGQALAEVDGRPVPLLLGPRPLWRRLAAGVDDGPDVTQLEMNLVALGVATGDELTVDDHWSAATTAAVEEWQGSLGLDATGVVEPGDLVFLPGAVRVVDHPTPVGGSASGTVLEVTGTTRSVTVDLEATRQTLVEVGQAVRVEMPDGTSLTGTVREVGTVATVPEDTGDDPAADEGEATVTVTVALDDPAQAGSFDEAPVTVSVVTSAAEGVLAVPVDALLALSEGGYAVERVTATGTELVGVETGAYADGWVEVTGDVAEGDEVVVPA
ncbi:MAG TPA: peptidoglycan-binding protein [Acidimicrobiales bacterium]